MSACQFIPNSIDELEDMLDYGIVNNTEYTRLLNILLSDHDDTPQQLLDERPQDLDHHPEDTPQPQTPQTQHLPFVVGTTDVDNEDGTFVRTINFIDDVGRKVQTVQHIKRTTRTVHIPRRVIERRNILKFGQCQGKPPGPEQGITNYGDIVKFEIAKSKKIEEAVTNVSNVEQGALIKCRKCGQRGHWTMQCPHNDKMIEQMKSTDELIQDTYDNGDGDGDGGGLDDEQSHSQQKYIPPSRRTNELATSNIMKTNLRVSNLCEDAHTSDLRDLFSRIGNIKSARVITDRYTGISRGFGFVEFDNQNDAQTALDRLNGYAYGHQILKVEWATPKERK